MRVIVYQASDTSALSKNFTRKDFKCPCGCTRQMVDSISIHALREEGDMTTCVPMLVCSYFYPRPPRGGRQQKQRQNLYFQTNYTTFCTNLEEP